jgi:hypothetical protein
MRYAPFPEGLIFPAGRSLPIQLLEGVLKSGNGVVAGPGQMSGISASASSHALSGAETGDGVELCTGRHKPIQFRFWTEAEERNCGIFVR